MKPLTISCKGKTKCQSFTHAYLDLPFEISSYHGKDELSMKTLCIWEKVWTLKLDVSPQKGRVPDITWTDVPWLLTLWILSINEIGWVDSNCTHDTTVICVNIAIDSLTPTRCGCNFSDFQAYLIYQCLKYLLQKCLHVNAAGPNWSEANISSVIGLMQSGKKPLPESMLTEIYVTIWHHKATMS